MAASDARTATMLVCSELRQRGETSLNRYRVSFDKLGDVTFMRLRVDNGSGPVVERTLRLNSVEEAQTAAPRLVESVLGKKRIEEARRIDNVMSAEGQHQKKLQGDIAGGASLLALWMPRSSVGFAPGLQANLDYQLTQFSLGPEVRYAAGSAKTDSVHLFGAGIAAKYSFLTGEVSPYVGAGFGYSDIEIQRHATPEVNGGAGFDAKGNGMGSFAQVGLQVLRLHTMRLDVGARVDLPFYRTNEQGNGQAAVAQLLRCSRDALCGLDVQLGFSHRRH